MRVQSFAVIVAENRRECIDSGPPLTSSIFSYFLDHIVREISNAPPPPLPDRQPNGHP